MLLFIAAIALIAVGPDSGPPKGAALPKLKVIVVRDELRAAEEITERRKDKPTLYVFITKEKWERPTARFLRTIDEELERVHNGKMVVAWIADNSAEENAEYLRKVEKSLMIVRTMWTVHHGEIKELEDWEINPDAAATAVIAEDGKVVKSIGYRQTNEADAKDIIKKMLGK